MNLIIKQDIIEFYEIMNKAKDKICELYKSGRYNQIPLSRVVDRLDLVVSDFKSAVFYSMGYAEFTEIMDSIEQVKNEHTR
jgi:hypothetical protein